METNHRNSSLLLLYLTLVALLQNISLLKAEWHCCKEVLPSVTCQQMLIHAVMNDKKTSHCRGTPSVKFKFLYHLLSRRIFKDTEDYGSILNPQYRASAPDTVLCWGLQTMARDFRQNHCTGLSSRGCLTSSSRLRVPLGLMGCQMTCPMLQAAKIKEQFPLDTLWYSVVLWSSAVIYFFADPFLFASTP